MSRWNFLIALLFAPTLAIAQVNALPSVPHLLVKGHAEGRYEPDRFTINLLVQATAKAPDAARAKVEAHMQQIFKALDSNGALRERTQASSLRIEPNTEYRDGKEVFLGTQVSRTASAVFDDLDKLRAFIGQVPANEEVRIQGTEMGCSDIDQIRLDLRKRAIANSRDTAKEIAAAYGLSVKGVYSVSEVAPDFSYGIRAAGGLGTVTVTGARMRASAPFAADTDLRVGTIDEKQDIYAVYLTAPGATDADHRSE